MKSSIVKIKTACLLALIGLISPIFVIHAQSTLKPALKDLNESLNLLIAIKNTSSLNTLEKIKLEISARQDALNDIIGLLQAEIAVLVKKLDKPEKDETVSERLNLLKEYADYLNVLRQQINEDLNLQTVVDIARQFKFWKETAYDPKINQINRHLLGLQNEKIISIAETRLERINNDLDKIKSYILPARWNQLAELLAKAQASIEAAVELNTEEPGAVLGKIKEAYSYFLEMSRLVKK